MLSIASGSPATAVSARLWPRSCRSFMPMTMSMRFGSCFRSLLIRMSMRVKYMPHWKTMNGIHILWAYIWNISKLVSIPWHVMRNWLNCRNLQINMRARPFQCMPRRIFWISASMKWKNPVRNLLITRHSTRNVRTSKRQGRLSMVMRPRLSGAWILWTTLSGTWRIRTLNWELRTGRLSPFWKTSNRCTWAWRCRLWNLPEQSLTRLWKMKGAVSMFLIHWHLTCRRWMTASMK